MDIYEARYKCRLCNKEYRTLETGKYVASRCMLEITEGISSEEPLCPKMIEIHRCDNNAFGIADFLGFQKEEL